MLRDGSFDRGGWAIDRDQLQRAVAFADPTAVLVPARILRRVIMRDRGLRFFGGVAARQSSYVIRGAALGAIVEGQELGRRPGEPWPETVVLLAAPEPDEMAESDPGALLITVWRRLFRARVLGELRKAFDVGAIDAAGLAARLEAIGRTEFEEARSVLKQDGWLPPEGGVEAAYSAFAAVFLDLTRFATALRGYTFPAVEDPAAIETLLAADVDAAALFAATRPAGAPDPVETEPESEPGDALEHEQDHEPAGDHRPGHNGPIRTAAEAGRDRGRNRRLAAQARAATARGNTVRAAILWAGAALKAGHEEAEVDRASARAELKHLADRFTKALFVRKGEAEVWADALVPLFRRAARGFWSPEARMLYDLQKVCIDHEREVYRTDLAGWALSLGRRPLTRPLPHLRVVAMSNHLRGAARRLPKVRLSREERGRLEGLFRAAVHRVEHDLREQFRPRIDATLEETWVRPRDLPERVAYRKLVEELLDRIVGRGFTTLGDLRDAASQSNLKFPDLTGPAEFFQGDRLLKADRTLAERIDGVHRRGEVYLRWLQRFSSLAFGTVVGRAVTLFVALPYGGAFVLLKFLQEVDDLAVSHLTGVHHQFENAWSIGLLGSVALGAINFVRFRRQLLHAFRSVGRVLRAVLVDMPAWLLNNPLVRRLMDSPAVLAVWRFVLKPGLAAAAVWAFAWLAGVGSAESAGLAATGFIASCLVFNTSAGRALEEVAVEKVTRALRVLALEVIPGLFQLVMNAFARVLEWVEKLIYAVDEWLRFRQGQSNTTLALKAVLGLFWGVVAYAVRVCVNLLIEPQVNPIKHFPVVTVSHKVILPMIPTFARALTPVLGRDWSIFVTGTAGLLMPGVFGFLVWELKSNWQLYEANRPEVLGPVVVGSHGETVVRLVRPGFHSGTLPKLFGRLRRARRGGREGVALKRREALHHVEESVRRFVDRDLAALLRESRALAGADVRTGAIHLATNRIRFELLAGTHDAAGLWIDLEEYPGVLAAGVSRPGWLSGLEAAERRALGDALAGIYKMSGVELIHTPGDPVDPPLPASSVVFSEVVVRWRDWVETWESEQTGSPTSADRPGWPGLLPDPEPRHAPLPS